MTNAYQPNSVISNLVWPFVVLLCTTLTMRVRNNLCKRLPSLRTKFAVDLRNLILTNLISFAAMVVWSFMLNVSIEVMLAVDLMIGVFAERWVGKVIASYDGKSYHPGGAVGRHMVNQHMRLACLLATLTRAYSAAFSAVVVQQQPSEEHLSDPTYYVMFPLLYTFIRTILLDFDQQYVQHEIEIETHCSNSEFQITDEEDEYMEQPSANPIHEQDDQPTSMQASSDSN